MDDLELDDDGNSYPGCAGESVTVWLVLRPAMVNVGHKAVNPCANGCSACRQLGIKFSYRSLGLLCEDVTPGSPFAAPALRSMLPDLEDR